MTAYHSSRAVLKVGSTGAGRSAAVSEVHRRGGGAGWDPPGVTRDALAASTLLTRKKIETQSVVSAEHVSPSHHRMVGES